MTRNKEDFVEMLAPIRKRLPKRYGTIAKVLYPNIKLTKIHNVVNLGTVDWEVLKALKDVVKVYERGKARDIQFKAKVKTLKSLENGN